VGPAGFEPPDPRTLARDWLGTLPPERPRQALFHKLLSDVTREPLALDGALGERSREAAALLAANRTSRAFDSRVFETVRRLWE
jgi:hypothetical protein